MKASSQDDKIQDWSQLLQAVRASEGELRAVGPFVEELEDGHDQAVSLRCRRDALLASAMELTAEMHAVFAMTQDAARALRRSIRPLHNFVLSSSSRGPSTRSSVTTRRRCERTIWRASFAAIATSHERNRDGSRSRRSSRQQMPHASWAASFARSASRVMTWHTRTMSTW